MADNVKRYESLLFNNETSSRNAYRDGQIPPLVKTVYKEKPTCLRLRPPPLKDTHALTPWRVPNVPFGLFYKPKPELCDPRKTQQRFEAPVDLDRPEVQRSRPRIIMTPAVVIDDINEPLRQEFVDNLYISSSMKALNDALDQTESNNVRSPLSDVYAPSNPIMLKRLRQPYVSPEWRMDSVKWDNRQMRTYTSPTRKFWLARTPQCSVCKSTAIRQAMKKMTCG